MWHWTDMLDEHVWRTQKVAPNTVEWPNSIANALELPFSWTNPSIFYVIAQTQTQTDFIQHQWIKVPYQVYMHLVKIQIILYSWYIMKYRHVRRPPLSSDEGLLTCLQGNNYNGKTLVHLCTCERYPILPSMEKQWDIFHELFNEKWPWYFESAPYYEMHICLDPSGQ